MNPRATSRGRRWTDLADCWQQKGRDVKGIASEFNRVETPISLARYWQRFPFA